MTTVTIRLSIAETGDYDDKGRKTCVVKEEHLGTGEDAKVWGPMPCVVAAAFCRAKRSQFMSEMYDAGGVIILPH